MKKRGIAGQIQSKIGQSISFVFLIVAVVVLVLTTTNITKANNTELTLESEGVSYRLNDFFNQYCSMAEGITANIEILEYMETVRNYQDIKRNLYFKNVLRALKSIKALKPEVILNAWIADSDASAIIIHNEYISEEGWDVESRPWYRCTELRTTILTEPYEDVSSGKIVLTIASPVYNITGKVVGVFGLDILLDDVIDTVSECVIGESGYVMLLSADGQFIYHPDQQYVNTMITDMDLSQEIKNAVLNQEEVFTGYKLNGEKKYGYVDKVGDTGYMVISSITGEEYFKSISTMLISLVAVFAAGMVIIFIVMKRVASKITRPLKELNVTAQQLAEGNLQVELHVKTEDEIGELANSIGKTVARLKEYINYIDEVAKILEQIADGRLAINLKYSYTGEFGRVKEALLHISKSMIDVMQNIQTGSEQVEAGADDLAKAAQGLAEGTEAQAAAIEELLATAVIVADQVEENKNDAEKSAMQTNEVTVMMEESQKQMNDMREAMNKIQEASHKVVGIIRTIEDIAEETNLLSLNASIEAARAGEAGRGFAVVAGEIGNLANESARAVNTTRELISVSLEEIDKGNSLVDEVVSSLTCAVEKTEEVNEMIQKTAKDAVLQMKSIQQIRTGIEEISNGIKDNSFMAEETSATSEELAAQVVTLNDLVGKFELS